jgi:hypothetical protein
MANGPMNSLRPCPICGRPLTRATAEGLCLVCLLKVGIEKPEESHSPQQTGEQPHGVFSRFFGDYQLLREVGHGGMGVVYEAQQFGTQRSVALKLLASGVLANREAIHRFHTEAQTAALLEHPNIVPVYEVGMHDGQYFLVMRFLGGGTLAELAAHQALPPSRIAEIMQKIAAAVHFAHSRGVLHRDLKPSNILLSDEGVPLVSDFGLARIMTVDDRLTLSTSLLGTAAYVAPEQIKGGAALSTIASDIYSLGAVFYELLAAQPPFRGSSLGETLRLVQEQQPLAPSKVAGKPRRVPPDLETICLKCLEKDPSHRYSTAQELSDDLNRFLTGEPIHARPSGQFERAWRWCCRKPALATLGALALALLLVICLGAPIAVLRINHARLDAEKSRLDAKKIRLEAQRGLYAAHMIRASEALRNGAFEQVRDLLDKHNAGKDAEDLRGFEWRYLRQAAERKGWVTHQFHGQNPGLVVARGALYIFQLRTDHVLAWDTATWAPLPLKVPAARASHRWWWYPANQAALAVDDEHRTIALFRLPGFEELAVISIPGQPSHTALSKDVGTLAVAFQDENLPGVLLWDRTANSQRFVFRDNRAAIIHLGFSPDGQVLMAACDDGQVELWSITESRALPAPKPESSNSKEDWQQSPFFGPDSTLLFLNRGRRKALEVWDWNTGQPSIAYQSERGRLETFAFSPDGLILALASPGGVIALLDAKHPRPIDALPAKGAKVTCLAFSSTGRLLASGGLDRIVKVWDVKEHVSWLCCPAMMIRYPMLLSRRTTSGSSQSRGLARSRFGISPPSSPMVCFAVPLKSSPCWPFPQMTA